MNMRIDWSGGPVGCAECGRLMRPGHVPESGFWEGTARHGGRGLCGTCYARSRHPKPERERDGAWLERVRAKQAAMAAQAAKENRRAEREGLRLWSDSDGHLSATVTVRTPAGSDRMSVAALKETAMPYWARALTMRRLAQAGPVAVRVNRPGGTVTIMGPVTRTRAMGVAA